MYYLFFERGIGLLDSRASIRSLRSLSTSCVYRSSPSEFLAPAIRRLLISACAFHFVLRDAAVTVLVVLQNKLTRLVNKLAAGDLSILVFIKVAEVRVCEGSPSPTYYREFGRIEMPVAVAIGQGK
jgi:hypothetical protein